MVTPLKHRFNFLKSYVVLDLKGFHQSAAICLSVLYVVISSNDFITLFAILFWLQPSIKYQRSQNKIKIAKIAFLTFPCPQQCLWFDADLKNIENRILMTALRWPPIGLRFWEPHLKLNRSIWVTIPRTCELRFTAQRGSQSSSVVKSSRRSCCSCDHRSCVDRTSLRLSTVLLDMILNNHLQPGIPYFGSFIIL